RTLWKNKGFSAINIIGLSIGLASFILISLYVIDELSYDRYNEKADRIFRINSDIRFGGNNLVLAVCSDPMGPTLKKDYPQVEEFVRFYQRGSILLKKDNQFINEQNVIAADSTLFNVFTLPAVAGDTKTALDNPHSVVITASTAQKYFGTTDAVGKVLQSDGNNQYQVTAVIKDIPQNSHFHFDCIFSMKDVNYTFGNFLSNNFQTYLLLKKGVDYKAFEKNFKQVMEKYLVPQARQFMNINSMDEFEKAGNKLNYSLIPLTDIHLHSDRTAELGTNSNIQYVYIFSVVALFILLLACINFMNLSTARSANRAKEVGIRKVMGSDKRSLIRQFMVESLVMSFFSLLIAILLVWIALPFFNTISGKSMQVFNLFGWKELVLLSLLPVIVGILAGSYPAFYLSSFQPILVLKGKLTTGFKRSGLRNALVVFQFATSIILIIGTIIVYGQLNYIRTTKLGFQKDQVLVINNTHSLGNGVDAFKNELSQLPGVKSASVSGFLPIPSNRSDNTFSRESVLDVNNGINMQTWRVDYDYLRT
ncbi:MAG: ABC transporter permease, partial [Bacteroidota bacterium]|nr:ABC transporter permease [Bacteroidota bacterium]